jgi:hypothetical protein
MSVNIEEKEITYHIGFGTGFGIVLSIIIILQTIEKLFF